MTSNQLTDAEIAAIAGRIEARKAYREVAHMEPSLAEQDCAALLALHAALKTELERAREAFASEQRLHGRTADKLAALRDAVGPFVAEWDRWQRSIVEFDELGSSVASDEYRALAAASAAGKTGG